MSMFNGRFLPDRFRPRDRRRRTRRGGVAPAAAVGVALVLLPLWTVQEVEVTGADVVPPAVAASLESLTGHSVLLLDLDWVRMLAATWPAAGEVRVRLDLPDALVVEVFPEVAHGSARVGAGWHAVAATGRFAGAIAAPIAPRLEGYKRPAGRRQAFGVARRINEASGGTVESVSRVTPADYRVDLRFDGRDEPVRVHVVPAGTGAERAWCRAALAHGPTADWADLRWSHRMVVRGPDPEIVEAGS